MKPLVRRGNVDDALAIERQIPEFEKPYEKKEYEQRLNCTNPLILIAEINGEPAGYKVGYDRYRDGSYYSWVGGVLPQFRGLKLANALADEQETRATAQGYSRVILKTQTKYENMIAFAQKIGFVLINVDAGDGKEILVLEKRLVLHDN